MNKSTYEIVEHDGDWAYRVGGVFSETFPNHDVARRAAERAAKEQVVPGQTTDISYEDKDGLWHDELPAGHGSGSSQEEKSSIFSDNVSVRRRLLLLKIDDFRKQDSCESCVRGMHWMRVRMRQT